MAMDRTQLVNNFLAIFGGEETDDIGTYFAPGRIIFCGEHNDHNGGMVLPATINLGTYAAIRRRSDPAVHVYSTLYPQDGIQQFNIMKQIPDSKTPWINYPQGALWSLLAHGHRVPTGFDIFYYSDLPTNAGLGSSASIIIATLYSLIHYFEIPNLSKEDISLISLDAENSFLDFVGSILSPFTLLKGKKDTALFFASSALHYEYIPLPKSFADAKIVITNSNVEHDSTEVSEMLEERQKECADGFKYLSNNLFIKSICDMDSNQFESYKDFIPFENVTKRIRHIVYENERTYQAFNSLRSDNLTRFGKILNESYISIRDNYDTTCPEVDTLVEAAWACPGVIASRMIGAGLGGCTLSIVMKENIDEFIENVGKTYEEKTGLTATFFIANVDGGAREIE